jgi:glutathione S-transferase
MKPATLLTIPFSHYCEKARWALDHARIPYVEEGHVPGFHRIAVRRAKSAKTSVPVLLVDGRVLGDSTDILAWVDAQSPADKKLYPTDDVARRDVLALEDELDEELGPHIRRVMYFHFLPNRALIFSLMDQRTPGWEKAALRVVFPFLRKAMKRFMRIDARGAEESREKVLRAFDGLEKRLADGRPFLHGDRFGAADITLGALAGFAVTPPEHMLTFPPIDAMPAPVQELVKDIQTRPVGDYLRRMYREHRA